MKVRTVSVPRNQLSYYRVGFVSVELKPGPDPDTGLWPNGYLRTTKTIAIDHAASTVTKEVIAGEEYPPAT
jgi:hypothetical protein